LQNVLLKGTAPRGERTAE